ncbi:MAG: HU family DNA-binding protein [Clostridia bacterium]|nr:HU family DNA-binding protein [Clostridia bacterium]MBQ2110303.1 HU family DNA-binding protein [Clostridia bacterium]MBR4635115.1 HU family DNA-binding protein [Clostridia bacterium]
MNKAQLISALTNTAKLSRRDADVAVNSIFDIIIDQLRQGEKVQIVGFGAFDVRERPARKGRNPMTGEAIEIEATRSVAFKPGKSLKDAMEQK